MKAASLVLALLLSGCAAPAPAGSAGPSDPTPSPYADQLGVEVRGLSQQELDDLLAGRGAGYARPAELNGHPGPLHVLELAEGLDLSGEQRRAFEDLYARMQDEAQAAGRRVVDAHAALEEAFRGGDLNETSLAALVADLDDAYGAYRLVHLRYHLLAKPLLTEHQRMEYDRLRGYGGHDAGHDAGHHDH